FHYLSLCWTITTQRRMTNDQRRIRHSSFVIRRHSSSSHSCASCSLMGPCRPARILEFVPMLAAVRLPYAEYQTSVASWWLRMYRLKASSFCAPSVTSQLVFGEPSPLLKAACGHQGTLAVVCFLYVF